ncbi:hypothetical protein AA313_de0202278 [Arthrobotrys entomopaga]|nr:hypothetical protein AA313_de0202278 [Arthrobotrys entomopaga]
MSGLDALGIGANVVGVFVFGLQAVKFIADTVSKYQDAEEDYESFLGVIQNLAQVLTEVNDVFKLPQDKIKYSRLYTVSKQCEDDLDKFYKRLQGWLEPNPRSRKHSSLKTWRKFKMALLENDAKKYETHLHNYYDRILVSLQLVQGKSQKETAQLIESGIASISQSISEVSTVQHETLNLMDNVKTTITTELETNSMVVQGLQTSVGNSLDKVTETLNSIESQVETFNNTHFHRSVEEREQDEVEKATGKLYQLSAAAVTREEAKVPASQTLQVLEEVQKIIRYAGKGKFGVLKKSRMEDSFDEADQQRKAMKLAALVGSSDSVVLGQKTPNIKTLQHHRSKFTDTRVYLYEQRESILRVSQVHQYIEEGGGDNSSNNSRYLTRFTYIPKADGFSAILVLDILQQNHTAIVFGETDKVKHLINSKSASIFDCDKSGQSLLMRSLITANKNCLNIGLETETSTLMRNRIDIAKYLIDQGSDINHMDNNSYDTFSLAKGWYSMNVINLLLHNGSNPMLRASPNMLTFAKYMKYEHWGQFLSDVTEFYDINDLLLWPPKRTEKTTLIHEVICDYTLQEIWDLPSFPSNGTQAVPYPLAFEHERPPYDVVKVLTKLVSHGANPHINTSEGENCIHYAL